MGKPPNRFRLDFNWLTGIRADRWWELLRREGFAVDGDYLFRAAAITALSVVSATFAGLSRLRFGEPDAPVAPPVFVLGHWRQGTTHLHNLLSLDPALTSPTTWEVMNPDHFRLTRAVLPRLLRPLLPPVRPQDAMELGFELPQEEEYAIALTSLVSPHFALVFPRTGDRYLTHLTLRRAPADDVARWKAAMLQFARRHAAADPRPLLLKSPPHTGRIRLLLELFPDARFVHIHRDPYTVFASMRRLVDTTASFQHLQVPPQDQDGIDARILSMYTDLYDAWFEDRGRIPAGRLVEIAFTELETDAVGTLRRVYDGLGMPGFDALAPKVAAEVARLGGYQKTRHPRLTPAERATVAERWARSFSAWGYPI